jgi:hypothetical protein
VVAVEFCTMSTAMVAARCSCTPVEWSSFVRNACRVGDGCACLVAVVAVSICYRGRASHVLCCSDSLLPNNPHAHLLFLPQQPTRDAQRVIASFYFTREAGGESTGAACRRCLDAIRCAAARPAAYVCTLPSTTHCFPARASVAVQMDFKAAPMQ